MAKQPKSASALAEHSGAASVHERSIRRVITNQLPRSVSSSTDKLTPGCRSLSRVSEITENIHQRVISFNFLHFFPLPGEPFMDVLNV